MDFYATLEYSIYLVKNAKFLRMENYVSNTAYKIMFFFQTDYEGQIKTLTQYIDPKTDGIIVAGGDGTLLEVRSKILYLTYQIPVNAG